jgi:pimeloyl-ACP methyl ester carboxylesterase
MNTATPAAPRLSVAEAFQRFETEATHGSVDLSRYRCDYAVWGEGPTLVLIHGLADRMQSFALPMAGLSRQFRCIAYNQPIGRGDGCRLSSHTHEQLLGDLFELLDHLRVTEATVLGHSYGSSIALEAMAAQEERIPRGILLCGFAHRPLSKRERALAWLAGFLPGSLRHIPARMKAMQRAHVWAFEQLEPERWSKFIEQTGDVPICALSWWARQLHRTNVTCLLSNVRQPVLLAYGEHDLLVRPEQQVRLFNGLPNSVMYEIRGCGHFPMWTHPEVVVNVVEHFARGVMCDPHACPWPDGAGAPGACPLHADVPRVPDPAL